MQFENANYKLEGNLLIVKEAHTRIPEENFSKEGVSELIEEYIKDLIVGSDKLIEMFPGKDLKAMLRRKE